MVTQQHRGSAEIDIAARSTKNVYGMAVALPIPLDNGKAGEEMKQYQQHADQHNTNFNSVPVVRLDSGAIRIPVELIDSVIVPSGKKTTLRITVKKGSYWAWRS